MYICSVNNDKQQLTINNMTSSQIHKYAKLTGLKQDLESAFEYRTLIGGSDWIYGIDGESMDELKAIYAIVDGTYSIHSLAMAILRNRTIILAEV